MRYEREPVFDTDHFHGLQFFSIPADRWEQIFGKKAAGA